MAEWFVYVLCADDVRKIGISQNIESRIRQLQTGNAARIDLDRVFVVPCEESARIIEKKCHAALKYAGVHAGGEWFHINSQLANRVIRSAAKVSGRTIELVFHHAKEKRRAKRRGDNMSVGGVAGFLKNNQKRKAAKHAPISAYADTFSAILHQDSPPADA